ncbi:MAG: TerB family tellurite resistance protein [Rhodovarius sp.]|nr:TerB family tellurite resistance protein [Rhodovarius sp.]MCX7931061.1 TerB family tellurite resistance protein [Rhodovarius sp.]MDW8315391.1 TerB family tellurite resistance protein [Rhodovarius sp.]
MAIWGKIIGGLTGFLAGGPLGALIGAAAGHVADRGGLSMGKGAAGLAARFASREQLFAVGVVVLAAKLAKCDGPVKREEINAFKQAFRIPPENLREVGRLFDSARESPEGFEPFADRLGEAFADQPQVLEDVLRALFAIARADGPLTRGEVAFLQRVQMGFRLDAAAWKRARDGQTATMAAEAPDPYAVLGLHREATDEEVRAAWRRLMRELHPDALQARGAGPEETRRAALRVAEINAAWDRIKRERGL